MALLTNIVNTLKCGLSGVFGAGLAHCKFIFKDMAGGAILLLKKGTQLPEDITLDSLRALQVAGKLIVLKDPVSFEDQSGEDQVETFSSGVEVDATSGLYKLMFQFVNGLLFNNVLASLNSQGAYDVVLVDAGGNAIFYTSKSGVRKGFTLGRLKASKIAFASGATTNKTGIMMQLINRVEMDQGLSVIDASQLDFSLLELEGINQMEITLDAPADGAVSITGKLVSKWDGNLTVPSIALEDFTFTGVVPTAAVVGDDGTLTLTVPALSADQAITASINGVYTTTEGQLFKSNTAKVVVTA
ncbi:hypothetical protein AAU57_11975 [Nonlabens sp. YIK11]|uniref:hypothetical protein n=1 Tax=Nonlabens sp. YIK11 TaxID=1453349 RepID=UPI0006DC4D5A|nr:hypothetical protein [Nonlabens sp. YIK11]KQC33966.1 hypothetical protein AAU57_11975 [Nonlabens sp. YIK11]